MSIASTWLAGLPATLALAVAVWALATSRRNAGLVDIFWSLFMLAAAGVYASLATTIDARAVVVLALLAAWALRLATHLAVRNWNAPEDRRYRDIRARNEPNFALKSLYLVFLLQGVLAWIVTAPLAVAIAGNASLSAWDVVGVLLVAGGIGMETVADAQLERFKADRANAGRVMDRGLWRYSRHPNYFGEFCVWWGFYLLAVPAGGAWTVFSPLLMSVLLLRVSGVTLLEKDIAERRPGYREYVMRTNAFFPSPPRAKLPGGPR